MKICCISESKIASVEHNIANAKVFTLYGFRFYHESFEAEKFHGFRGFLHVCKTFVYESLRWHCSNIDLRESMCDSMKVFS